jgi:hypothetical protein
MDRRAAEIRPLKPLDINPKGLSVCNLNIDSLRSALPTFHTIRFSKYDYQIHTLEDL